MPPSGISSVASERLGITSTARGPTSPPGNVASSYYATSGGTASYGAPSPHRSDQYQRGPVAAWDPRSRGLIAGAIETWTSSLRRRYQWGRTPSSMQLPAPPTRLLGALSFVRDAARSAAPVDRARTCAGFVHRPCPIARRARVNSRVNVRLGVLSGPGLVCRSAAGHNGRLLFGPDRRSSTP